MPLKLTHQTLGSLVGARRPSVTTALNQLIDEGSYPTHSELRLHTFED